MRRRDFLQFLAASPLLASALPLSLSNLLGLDLQAFASDEPHASGLITSPDQALDVMAFEPVARNNVPTAHYGYLITGVDDDATVQANRDGFKHVQIRSRRLVNVENIDMSVKLFGTTWPTPIFLCPVSSMKAFHDEGEIAVARAARAKNHLQILSTVASSSIEDTTKARGGPVWQQLYPTDDWNIAKSIIRRAESAGSPAIVFTVDLHDNSNRETLLRAVQADKRDCNACHEAGKPKWMSRPMFKGVDLSKVTALTKPAMDWEFVKRLRDTTRGRFLVKGIVTREDAALAVENGVDGIVVSNHGGRAEETLRSTIECLPEVVEGAKGRVPVLVDSGFRRGTDVFKALALGATAVGVGRPYAWGLGAFGQPGVEAVLSILTRELRTIMQQAGTTSVAAINRNYVVTRWS